MSSITQESEIASATPIKTARSWRLGATGWILILGLVALNVGVLFEYVDWNKRTLGWLLFRIDPRYWPLWPVPILWGIVAWMVNNTLKNRFRWIEKKQGWIKTGIVLGCLCWMVWLSGWTFKLIRNKIYMQVYVAYIMGPISLSIVDGKWRWQLMIAPTLAVIAIGSLLYVAYKQRKKNHESKHRIEKSSENAE